MAIETKHRPNRKLSLEFNFQQVIYRDFFLVCGNISSTFPKQRTTSFTVRLHVYGILIKYVSKQCLLIYAKIILLPSSCARDTPINHSLLLLPRVQLRDRPIMCANLYDHKHARVMAALPRAISHIIVDGTDQRQATKNYKKNKNQIKLARTEEHWEFKCIGDWITRTHG